MPIIPFIHEKAGEMRAVFEDLHRHPEIGFEEKHASGVVAGLLEKWGFDEVHTGIAGTGVVGILTGRNGGNRRIGLRADMDALPIDETSGVPYSSQNPGRMHACGHDGHTTMLLGAAQYLAATRDFEGSAVFVFQPAEEGLGGARRMISEGLFERFPCDEIYGMHNQPLGTLGKAAIRKGAAMAGASFFDIKLTGKGSHAAQPHNARDVLVIGADLVGQLQTIVSRNIPATEACVVSCTQFHTGSAYNIVPEVATITGTIRYFEQRVCDLAESRLREICAGVATGYGVTVDVDIRNVFDVLRNDLQDSLVIFPFHWINPPSFFNVTHFAISCRKFCMGAKFYAKVQNFLRRSSPYFRSTSAKLPKNSKSNHWHILCKTIHQKRYHFILKLWR